MASDKSLFAPVPLRAMASDLSGLQLRVLICVAAHDRMSLLTGKGQGCRASNERMSTMIGCSYARLCSTLSELTKAGYLQRESLGRHSVYRVIYTDDDRLLFGNVSQRKAPLDRLPSRGVTGCQHTSNNGAIPPETAEQYIPLNGGRYSVETGKENSSEEARLSSRAARQDEIEPTAGSQLARLERALKADPVSLDHLAWMEWLETIAGDPDELTSVSGWATRLSEQLLESMSQADYETWCGDHGLQASA